MHPACEFLDPESESYDDTLIDPAAYDRRCYATPVDRSFDFGGLFFGSTGGERYFRNRIGRFERFREWFAADSRILPPPSVLKGLPDSQPGTLLEAAWEAAHRVWRHRIIQQDENYLLSGSAIYGWCLCLHRCYEAELLQFVPRGYCTAGIKSFDDLGTLRMAMPLLFSDYDLRKCDFFRRMCPPVRSWRSWRELVARFDHSRREAWHDTKDAVIRFEASELILRLWRVLRRICGIPHSEPVAEGVEAIRQALDAAMKQCELAAPEATHDLQDLVRQESTLRVLHAEFGADARFEIQAVGEFLSAAAPKDDGSEASGPEATAKNGSEQFAAPSVTYPEPADFARPGDTPGDTRRKNSIKRRRLNRECLDLIERYKSERRIDTTVSMSYVVREYCREKYGDPQKNFQGLYRRLKANSDQWRR